MNWYIDWCMSDPNLDSVRVQDGRRFTTGRHGRRRLTTRRILGQRNVRADRARLKEWQKTMKDYKNEHNAVPLQKIKDDARAYGLLSDEIARAETYLRDPWAGYGDPYREEKRANAIRRMIGARMVMDIITKDSTYGKTSKPAHYAHKALLGGMERWDKFGHNDYHRFDEDYDLDDEGLEEML